MKRINLTFVVAAGLAFASFGATDLRELTFQVAVPCETAPVVDGAMDDACWAKAPAHTTYYQYYVANPPATNGYADCRIVYDQKGLYMAVRNPEPLMSKVKPKHVKNFDGGLWYDESAEIYFDPAAAGVGWYKFIVNCLGKHDSAYRMDPANLDENWVAKGIASAAKMFDDRWEFELFVPWTVFDNHPPAKPGEMWTCLHARFRWLEHPWKDFFATASGAIGGYSPNLFGYLYFSDGKPVPPKRILDILAERVLEHLRRHLDCRRSVGDDYAVVRLEVDERRRRLVRAVTGARHRAANLLGILWADAAKRVQYELSLCLGEASARLKDVRYPPKIFFDQTRTAHRHHATREIGIDRRVLPQLAIHEVSCGLTEANVCDGLAHLGRNVGGTRPLRR